MVDMVHLMFTYTPLMPPELPDSHLNRNVRICRRETAAKRPKPMIGSVVYFRIPPDPH